MRLALPDAFGKNWSNCKRFIFDIIDHRENTQLSSRLTAFISHVILNE